MVVVVLYVVEIIYQDLYMKLLVIEDCKVGLMLKDYIDGLCFGCVVDMYDWVVLVKFLVLV